MGETTIAWSKYMQYRLQLRGYDPATVEHILRYSSERYMDTVTGRSIAVGRHQNLLVLIPYELKGGILMPITIHATSRPQIKSRIKSGRFRND